MSNPFFKSGEYSTSMDLLKSVIKIAKGISFAARQLRLRRLQGQNRSLIYNGGNS